VLVQARAAGELASLADMRAVAAASADTVAIAPSADRAGAEALYDRFLDVIGAGRRAHRLSHRGERP